MANVSIADIKALREQLGTGMSDTKAALVEADGDLEKATEILRLKGAKGNAKRADRSTSEGLVAATENGNGTATLIELACETDFVAKGDKFIALADRVLAAVAAAGADSVEAALAAGLAVVVVGAGSAEIDAPDDRIFGLGRVSDAELCWVYRHAAVVVGAAREDFGLTVLEAALEGTPAATIAAGGYLETVRDGESGFRVAEPTASALAGAIRRARDVGPEACRGWAEQFGIDRHVDRLRRAMDGALRVPGAR